MDISTITLYFQQQSRTSQEVRELKSVSRASTAARSGRTSQEVRELKLHFRGGVSIVFRRTSQEVRELKSGWPAGYPGQHIAPRKRCVS